MTSPASAKWQIKGLIKYSLPVFFPDEEEHFRKNLEEKMISLLDRKKYAEFRVYIDELESYSESIPDQSYIEHIRDNLAYLDSE